MTKLFFWPSSFLCIVALVSCEWSSRFAPPPATAQMARQHVDLATLEQGRALYVSRCIECHTLPPFWHYREKDWPGIVDSMAHRANLKPRERDAIVAYILAARAE